MSDPSMLYSRRTRTCPADSASHRELRVAHAEHKSGRALHQHDLHARQHADRGDGIHAGSDSSKG